MKINWGAGVVIAFGLFMSFILYFVVKVHTNSEYDNDLVVEEYYKHDAKFGDEMRQVQNAHDLKNGPSITKSKQGIQIEFPKSYASEKIKGKVSLYRPSDKKLDFEIPISKSGPSMLIPETDLAGGRWDITLSWEYEGVDYIKKQTFYLDWQ